MAVSVGAEVATRLGTSVTRFLRPRSRVLLLCLRGEFAWRAPVVLAPNGAGPDFAGILWLYILLYCSCHVLSSVACALERVPLRGLLALFNSSARRAALTASGQLARLATPMVLFMSKDSPWVQQAVFSNPVVPATSVRVSNSIVYSAALPLPIFRPMIRARASALFVPAALS